jgi:protein-tyrosine phosphatase
MAKGIFIHKIKQRGLEKEFFVDSAGTGNWHEGESADPRTIQTLDKKGIELKHSARQIEGKDLENFDFILAMDNNNFRELERLKNLFQNTKVEIFLLRNFDPEGKNLEVPDPYFDGLNGFETVYEMIDRSLDNFLEYVLNK